MKIIILSIIALTFFTTLHAEQNSNKEFDLCAANLNYDKSEALISGISLNINPKLSDDKFGFKVAYQGDYLILNQFMPTENKIDETNVYAELSYKF